MGVVIILSESDDLHSLSVKHEIEELDFECCIINTAEFPAVICLENRLEVGCATQKIHIGGSSLINSNNIEGIWRRRIYNHEVSHELEDSYKEISKRDSRAALDGFFLTMSLSGCRIINDPIYENAALNKVYQLDVARRIGLSIPKTLITNNQDSVKDFFNLIIERSGKVIYKAFNSPKNAVITSAILVPEDFARIGDLRYAPVIFQEFVEGRDLRVTFVSGNVFSAEVIVSIPEAKRDWRLEMYNKIIPYKLSSHEHDLIGGLMRELKLEYGALDFKLSDEGELVFLEVNPWGQFLFVEIQTGLPISRSIAQALTGCS